MYFIYVFNTIMQLLIYLGNHNYSFIQYFPFLMFWSWIHGLNGLFSISNFIFSEKA